MHKLYFDGASRGNPGLASYGGVIYDGNNAEKLTYCCKFEHPQTNNYAEYYGILRGMELALENDITELEVYGDSSLVINQLNGLWKVKSPNIEPLYKTCLILKKKFIAIRFNHVLRKFNKRADEMANKALDYP
jgi:ribonuclease HI